MNRPSELKAYSLAALQEMDLLPTHDGMITDDG
jgi:hypothetical protein